jgi:hypothetical protein
VVFFLKSACRGIFPLHNGIRLSSHFRSDHLGVFQTNTI